MPKESMLREAWDFMKARKAWWLAPVVIMLVLVGALIIVVKSSSIVSPLIYVLF